MVGFFPHLGRSYHPIGHGLFDHQTSEENIILVGKDDLVGG